MRHFVAVTAVLFTSVLLYGCPERVNCGDGSGVAVPFCRQILDYRSGDFQQEEDTLEIQCIVGPRRGVVYESPNGTYYCSGTYKLTNYPSATIAMHWGGTTTYSMYDTFEIDAPGEGTFTIGVTKESGGSGNMWVSMRYDTAALHAVPLNTLCDEDKLLPFSLEEAYQAARPEDLQNPDILVDYQPYSYLLENADGQ